MSDFEVCPFGTLQRLAAVEAERDALREILDHIPQVEAELAETSDKLHAVEAERDALRADAERYRWLRSARDENFWHCHEKDGYGGQILMYGVDLDAAIDAAKGGGND